jgi:hypothetical protein
LLGEVDRDQLEQTLALVDQLAGRLQDAVQRSLTRPS